MIEVKVSDYITVSLLPGDVECTPVELAHKMLEAWMIEDLADKFLVVAQNFMYAQILRYGDIQLKIPYDYNYKKQGVCLEISGSGLNYYCEYLATHRVNADLRLACRRFIGLAKLGFKSTCSRFDVAFDEIHTKDDNENVLLDLDVIKSTLLSGSFVTRFRKGDPIQQSGTLQSSVFTADPSISDNELPYRFIESQNFSTGRIGKTIELGKRKSSSFVRFYDKLAEQEAHKFKVSDNLTSWIRFEIEYKHTRACSVFMAYSMCSNDDDFSNYMRSCALNLIRFVDVDHSRKYNCTICSWWYEFLNHVQAARLVYHKPKYNRYVRSLESKKRQQAASLAALIACDQRNLKSILLSGFRQYSRSAEAIISDFKVLRGLDPDEYDRVYIESTTPETGYDFWKHFVPNSVTDEDFEKFINEFLDDLCKEVGKIFCDYAECAV